MNPEELTKIVADAVDPIMEAKQIDKILALEAEVKSLKETLRLVIYQLRTIRAQPEYSYDNENLTGVDIEIDRTFLYELETKL
jgi:hypothetical protein